MILALVGYPEGYAAAVPRRSPTKTLHVEEGDTQQGGMASMSSMVSENGEIGKEAFAIIPELDGAAAQGPAGRPLTGLVHAEIEEDGDDPHAHARGDPRLRAAHLARPGTETVARLLGFARGHAGPAPRPAPGAGRRPVAARATRSRSCCATRRRRRCSRAGSPRDVELHGVTIPQGATISLLNGSADRDERHFPDPDRFDIHRDIDRQLAFGYGAHFCIGAAVARLEGRGRAATRR